jgi:hypothetical protein
MSGVSDGPCTPVPTAIRNGSRQMIFVQPEKRDR